MKRKRHSLFQVLSTLAFILTFLSPGSLADDKGERPIPRRKGGQPPTAVALKTFAAIRTADGVQVKWTTGWEVDNLGFRLYRGEGGALKRVTPSILAGSALFAGQGTPLTSGRTYRWRDVGATGDPYMLEEITLGGKSIWHGPARVEEGSADLSGTAGAEAQPLSRLAGAAGDSPGAECVTRRAGPAPLAERVSLAPTDQQKSKQFELAAGRTFKVSVRRDGWYRMTRDELVASGLNPALDPRRLSLWADGMELAIRVRGEEDGRFDPGDSIEFYGQAEDTAWTDTRVYWLAADQASPRRISGAGAPAQGNEASSFPFTVERSDRVVYAATLSTGERDNFYGPVIEGTGTEIGLAVRSMNPASTEAASLEVLVQGVTEGAHRVRVFLNGEELGTLSFEGFQTGKYTAPLQLSKIRDGSNAVRLVALEGELDVSVVDAIRITYPRRFVAENDALAASLRPGQSARIAGFSSQALRVMDVTAADSPKDITGAISGSAGVYSVTVTNSGATPIRLLAVADPALGSPAGVVPNGPTQWNRSTSGIDSVIVSHRDFLAAAGRLRKQQEAAGFNPIVVDVEDLYDEFSFGTRGPDAIRQFLLHAASCCSTRPSYLLLLGTASLDPRNYMGSGKVDHVPARSVDTSLFRAPSDDWFADFDGAGVPAIAVGRIPVRTPAEADQVAAKFEEYRGSRRTGGWARKVLLVSDSADSFDFGGANSRIRSQLGSALRVVEVKRDVTGDPETRRTILDAITAGTSVLHYFGHGSVESWRGDLLNVEDSTTISNRSMFPLVVAMDCLNGFFTDILSNSLGEALLKVPAGGAIAVWTSSGLTDPADQVGMAEEFYRQLQQQGMTIGEAARRAKSAAENRDVRRTWVLLGDPTLMSPIAIPPIEFRPR